MATLGLVEYQDASPEVRAVFDDIMATRKTDWINNFWKALARDPVTLRRTWAEHPKWRWIHSQRDVSGGCDRPERVLSHRRSGKRG